jgi:hypothetical protein
MVEVASGRQKIVDRARLKSTSEVAGGAVQQELLSPCGRGQGEGKGNSIQGRDAQQEAHPNPKDWAAALLEASAHAGGKLTWINCGLCVDERI